MSFTETLTKIDETQLEELRHPLIYYPDPMLTQTSLPVHERYLLEEIPRRILKQQLLCQYVTMKMSGGVGMAAVQMKYDFPQKLPNRVLVFHIGKSDPFWLINPILIESEGEQEFEEGCLSLPTVFYMNKRAEKIRIAHQSEEGEFLESTFTGVTSVAVQHEMDHLDGKMFIDDMSILKRMRAKSKIAKYKKKLKAK